MVRDTLEIRLFSLKLEGDGFNKTEIVKVLCALVKVLGAKLGCF